VAQVEVFALRATIAAHRAELSKAIHDSVVEAVRYPVEKRIRGVPGDELAIAYEVDV
jgi:hypothetical protein